MHASEAGGVLRKGMQDNEGNKKLIEYELENPGLILLGK